MQLHTITITQTQRPWQESDLNLGLGRLAETQIFCLPYQEYKLFYVIPTGTSTYTVAILMDWNTGWKCYSLLWWGSSWSWSYMVVGFTTTCAISAYHHWSCKFESHSWRGVLNTTLCDKVCQWLATGLWFSPGTPVSSTNKTEGSTVTTVRPGMYWWSLTLLTKSVISHCSDLLVGETIPKENHQPATSNWQTYITLLWNK